MPEMIDGDVRGSALTIGPLEIPSVLADVDGFGFWAGGGSESWADLEVLDRAQYRVPSGRCHGRNQVPSDGSAITGVG